jgi:hypothetical protein
VEVNERRPKARRSVTKLGRFAESRGNVVPHSIPPRTGAGANFNHLGNHNQNPKNAMRLTPE